MYPERPRNGKDGNSRLLGFQDASQSRNPRMTTPQGALAKELQDLKAIARYWKTVSGIFMLAVAISPLAALLDSPVFPGVTRLWVPIIGPTCCLFLVLFLFFKYRDREPREIDRVATVLFVLAALLLISYVLAWLNWVIQVNDQWHVLGIDLTSEASTAVAQGKIPNDAQSLLDRFGHKSENRILSGRPA